MPGPTNEPPAVRPAIAWVCLLLVVVWTAAEYGGFLKLPTAFLSSRMDEILSSAALTAFFAGLLLNGFWTGNILSIFWAIQSKGKSWASRTDDPWMFWYLAAIYACLALLGCYLLVPELLAR